MPLMKKRVYRKRRRTVRRPRRYKRVGKTAYSLRRPTRIIRSPIPTRCFTRLKYVDTGSFSCGPGTLTSLYQFQTSMFDPRYSIGGHQPLFFDQYSAMYKSYIVYGMKYKISFISQFDYGASVYVVYRSDPVLDTNEETILEKSNRTVVRGYQQKGPFYTKGYVSVASVFGVKRNVVRTDDRFKALISASPENVVYITPYIRQYHPTLSKDTVVHVELTYYCEFLDRVDVAGS